MIPSHYHYSYSHKMPYSKIEAMGNMTTGWQMHKITRATHLPKPHITGSEVCEREKNSRLAAFCKDRHFPHPRFAIATNLRMQALDFVQFFLISTHTHTHITCQTPKQAPQENKSKISKSYERSFFFYGIIPKLEKQSPSTQQSILHALHINFQHFHNVFFNRAI